MACDHVPCDGCDWCRCWLDDPIDGDPPITHAAWHLGITAGLTVRDIVELAYAPAPADGYDLDDDGFLDDVDQVWRAEAVAGC